MGTTTNTGHSGNGPGVVTHPADESGRRNPAGNENLTWTGDDT